MFCPPRGVAARNRSQSFLPRPLTAFFRLSCLMLLTLLTMFAQSERGTITGTIRDTSGAIIPGAKITITNVNTGVIVTQVTNGQGEFTIPSLPPGTYNIRIEKEGFRPSEEKNLTLDAASTARADATLRGRHVHAGG